MRDYILNMFKELTAFDTTACEASASVPSNVKQLEFAKVLAERLKELGLCNVSVSEYGYVTGVLPSNRSEFLKIGLIAHMDTSPECSGENVKTVITENYNGEDIALNGGTVISPKEFPSLKNYIGKTIITADGTTLLGADDKAGITEIFAALKRFKDEPHMPRHEIHVAFTPDEEIGRGADYFDVNAFGCDFAYTIDGGELGELSYENFNAARAKISVNGKNVHPGYAKDIMVNSALTALELMSYLPKNEIPSKTKDYEGFFHLVSLNGAVEKTMLEYIIRDFDKKAFEERKNKIRSIADELNKKYGANTVTVEIYDEYENMLEVMKDNGDVIERAKKAMLNAGVKPLILPIRGGTDGARLSFMGLPCPNIFAGGHNFHGRYEYIPLESMEKAAEVIVNICKD